MKNLTRKLVAAALAATMAASLSACGRESAEEVMTKAQESMASVKSMSYDMTMDMEISAQGETLAVKTTAAADCIIEPMQMKMTMNMDMGELGAMDVNMYITAENGEYTLYSGMDMGDGALTWGKQTMPDMSALEQYDAKASMDMYISSAESFKENGTETISGYETVRYDGVISKDAMNEVMTASGVLEQLTQLGLDAGAAASMLTDLGDLPISIWVAKDSYIPVKYEMDMSAMMRSMMDKLMTGVDGAEEAQIEIGSVVMSMTISNIDGVESIVIPQEALDAAA